MAYKNYTTKIPASTSSAEVRAILVAHGATAYLEEYDGDGHVTALFFKIRQDDKVLAFQMPLRPEGVLARLKEDVARRRIKSYYATEAQAERIAWRIVRDWVDVQMAIVEAGIVRMTEVFTGYLLVDGNHTLHEIMEAKQFLLPPGNGRTKTSSFPDSYEIYANQRPSGENRPAISLDGVCKNTSGSRSPSIRRNQMSPSVFSP